MNPTMTPFSLSAAAVPRFNREFFDAEETFTRIGSGFLGGKATGLLLVRERILSAFAAEEHPGVEVVVPTLTVLTTELFDLFMERNQLYETAFSDLPDDRIAHAFQRAQLPAEHVGDLRALISRVHTPLAVRSSSLLEDAIGHPFAGVFTTKMIPNNEIEEDARFRRLIEAIKLVYASTFFAEAKAYCATVGQSIEDEKMAVIVQEVVGHRCGDRYYPPVSGVARSYSFASTGHGRPEDGVAYLALGLGKTIVDGGLSWGVVPAFPEAPPPFDSIEELLRHTQTTFWAVHMGPTPMPDPVKETECLVRPDLAAAEADDTLQLLASTHDPETKRLLPGLSGDGQRVLDFAPLLACRRPALGRLLQHLLELSRRAVGSEVEIELALDFPGDAPEPARIGFLQVRPICVAAGENRIDETDMFGPGVLVASRTVLGNGDVEDIRDVVYLRPDTIDLEPETASQVALDLQAANQALREARRSYLLLACGRWGTGDYRQGVPVGWRQISEVGAIVEVAPPGAAPDPRRGGHFFQNLLGLGIPYLAVQHDQVDWEWLEDQESVSETPFVRHVRTPQPLLIRVDGKCRRGVVRHAAPPTD